MSGEMLPAWTEGNRSVQNEERLLNPQASRGKEQAEKLCSYKHGLPLMSEDGLEGSAKSHEESFPGLRS